MYNAWYVVVLNLCLPPIPDADNLSEQIFNFKMSSTILSDHLCFYNPQAKFFNGVSGVNMSKCKSSSGVLMIACEQDVKIASN